MRLRSGIRRLVFGFETPEKDPGAAPQDTSAYSVRVHIALGSPRVGTAVLLGVYKGTLPCADCDGLETVLRIYAKGKFDFTYAFYVRTQTYRGAPHGDVTYSDRGEWTLLRGDATDENATVYQLNPDKRTRLRGFAGSGQWGIAGAARAGFGTDRYDNECDAEAGALRWDCVVSVPQCERCCDTELVAVGGGGGEHCSSSTSATVSSASWRARLRRSARWRRGRRGRFWIRRSVCAVRRRRGRRG